jgi:hypothetical protein
VKKRFLKASYLGVDPPLPEPLRFCPPSLMANELRVPKPPSGSDAQAHIAWRITARSVWGRYEVVAPFQDTPGSFRCK